MSTWMVTGATGHVGSAALRALVASHPRQRLVALVRDAARAGGILPAPVELRVADYNDRDALATALGGVTRLLWIASDGAAPDVLRHHANVLGAAVAAKVSHIVFTSIVDIDASSPFYFTPMYREAERELAACGLRHTVLRCGLYTDFLVDHWIDPAVARGVLAVPAGNAKVAPICRIDVAQAAAAALSADHPPHRVCHLTGPSAHAFGEIAELASNVHHTRVHYVSTAPADYLRRCWAELEDPWPHAFSSLFASIREDRYAKVSDDQENLLRRPATSLEAFLRSRLSQ
jgi:NAD(P)H dehydrogenase (quinone)